MIKQDITEMMEATSNAISIVSEFNNWIDDIVKRYGWSRDGVMFLLESIFKGV